ncbi:hypothetical protein E1301_Tti011802 [Triplophysa tibetana]|uniref:SGNH hydrolase-type esterase domain-containing protein n=1 Tax=Triplophysa tibetana TaxID=1572043 RepID=A0A5A9NL01_9TELE|nr:hypothetical protein E1301_Tti011802 [Triplophysa tibetana]
MASIPIVVICTSCHMFSLAFSFSGEGFTCDKCREVVRLTEKILELESRIQSLFEDSKSVRAVENFLDASNVSAHSSVPVENPLQLGNFVTVRRHSRRTKHHSTIPIKVSNRFAPLSDAPTEKPAESALVIGDSIVRNVNIEAPATIVKCLPGARAPDIKSNLNVLAKTNRKFSKIVIHVGANDVRLRQSEITKDNIKEVCELAKTMSDTVIFSGPLTAYRGDEIYSRLSSLNGWLSEWCLQNNIDFKRDGLHPSWDGVSLLSRNLAHSLNNAKV